MVGIAFLLTALLTSAGELTAPHVRTPFAVLVNVPSGKPRVVARSDLLREISTLLTRHTDFEMIDVDSQIVRRCDGKPSCMVAEVREGSRAPTYLLVATYFTHEQATERLSLVLLDTSSGSTILERMTEVNRPSDAFDAIARSVEVELRPLLEDAGHWHPFGAIEVLTSEPAALMLDDEDLGTVEAGTVRIQRVSAGTHQLRVEAAGFEPFVRTVLVRSDESATVEAELTRRLDGGGVAVRQGVLWTGVAAAAAGAAIVVYALVQQPERRGYCLHGPDVECEGGASFLRFGSASGEPFESGNGSGPPIAPIGLGLLGLGATWSLGTWLFGGEDEIPWIQALVGVGVFGLTLGLSLALDGDDPL